MFAEHGTLQGIRTLQHDSIVVGCVYLRIADGKVFAAVDVNAVAVGVDGYIVDGANVAACHDDGEVAATVDGDVADGDVAAQLQGNSLVASANAASLYVAALLGVLFGKALTINHAASCDADILLTFCPYQRVMEVCVPAVLVFRSTKHLALVVGFHRPRCGQDFGTSLQVKVDIALHSDAATEVGACRQYHLSATVSICRLDGLVDGYMVQRLTVAFGTVVANVINTCCCLNCLSNQHEQYTQ